MASATDAAARELPPVLLTDATWYGTVAAARDLGRRGVPVTLASDVLVAPARWSRGVSRTVRCPPTADGNRFLEWLDAFAARDPGHVHYPTSDDTAWITAMHRDSLEPRLRLYVPPLDALAALLDKSRLALAARAVGVATPRTWCPRDEGEVERLSRELPFPVLVKPRTQVLSGGAKGVRVLRREDLAREWSVRRDVTRIHPLVARHLPDAGLPLLQEHHSTSEHIYTIDGFVGGARDAFVTLGCTKLIQLPRGSGAGIAFEPAPVDPSLSHGLLRLFRHVGFVGVFDVEYVVTDGRPLLIDVNPRFYNHMSFELDRGMPLAWMAYLAALGREDALLDEIRAARLAPPSRRVYMHRRQLSLLLAAQRFSGTMSTAEVRAWRRWMSMHAEDVTDPIASPVDRAPAALDALRHAATMLRHPRSSLKGLLRGGRSEPRIEVEAIAPSST